MASLKCCVPTCAKKRGDGVILHKFPPPLKQETRFRKWVEAVGETLLDLDPLYIYNYRRICHEHFEAKFFTHSKFLAFNSLPTLRMSDAVPQRNILRDITNTNANANVATSMNTSDAVTERDITNTHANVNDAATMDTSDVNTNKAVNRLSKKITLLEKKNKSFSCKLKSALKLTENKTFNNTLKKFTTLAALFISLQFREIGKHKYGRRFSKKEKLMALSLYKMGPSAYRSLRKFFVLPAPITISRIISNANIGPGINDNLFDQLKKRVQNMSETDKICSLIFDEMSIMPHFYYNKRKDQISGFVSDGESTKLKIADHAIVFMVRGVIKNYKQAIYYSFCSGSTPKDELAVTIKNIIKKLQNTGLKVVSTICDQGATNTSAIRSLISETKGEYARRQKNLKEEIFEINGQKIIPLYDVPHLLKGLRNNLLTKDLVYTMDGQRKIAKWQHIIELANNIPSYKGMRLIKNFTENHVNPLKIPKMKVKYASQLFSRTTGLTMGYLARNQTISSECTATADIMLFFDELFDSFNGSYKNSEKRLGKPLLKNVTPSSRHEIVWSNSKVILQSMRFINKNGTECIVPSIKNWIHTIDNMILLKKSIFGNYPVKSFWCRHFNQDPLENYFGSIRRHGSRNTNPSVAGFESAFVSLLVKNISNNFSNNCEKDDCKTMSCMKKLFFKCKVSQKSSLQEIQYEDINDIVIEDYEEKKGKPTVIELLHYITGYVLSKAKKSIFKTCKICKSNLFDRENKSLFIKMREYTKDKKRLQYPTEDMVKLFSSIQDVVHQVIKRRSNIRNVKTYLKTILYVVIDTSSLKCNMHKNELVEFLFDFTSRFLLYNWCTDTNKILRGIGEADIGDIMQKRAQDYYTKRRKFRKS